MNPSSRTGCNKANAQSNNAAGFRANVCSKQHYKKTPVIIVSSGRFIIVNHLFVISMVKGFS